VEIITKKLSRDQFENEIARLVELLSEHQLNQLIVFYGFDCNLEQDELFKEIRVATSELREFIEQSETKGVFVLGDNNLHIEDANKRIGVLLCHESDIHATGDEEEQIIKILRSEWEKAGYKPSPPKVWTQAEWEEWKKKSES
jgi:hypothetical protein